LEQLAGLGNLPAVRELSDLISIGAQLHAEGGSPRPDPGGEALWLASVLAIATGEPMGLEEAKFALRAGNPGAETAARDAAISMASAAGLADALEHASQAIDSGLSDRPDLG
jgi:hypothetical protein